MAALSVTPGRSHLSERSVPTVPNMTIKIHWHRYPVGVHDDGQDIFDLIDEKLEAYNTDGAFSYIKWSYTSEPAPDDEDGE